MHEENFSKSRSFSVFNKDVVPILESRCSKSCHGIQEGKYADFMNDKMNGKSLYFPINHETAKIPKDQETLKEVFRLVTGVSKYFPSENTSEEGHSNKHKTPVIHSERVIYTERAAFSHLLRAPLVEDYGGLPHRGLDVFFSKEDPDYKAIRNWVDIEIERKSTPIKKLTPEAAFFKQEVLPVMVRNGCFLTSCHGSNVFNDLKLSPPLPGLDSTGSILNGFSNHMVEVNRNVVLGDVARLVNLGGDIKLSRLLVKNLPIEKGGIHQRGGNNQFFESYDDNDVKTIMQWMEMEKDKLEKELRTEDKQITKGDLGKLQGLLFIRGPKHNPRKFFSFDKFYPGSDIFFLPKSNGNELTLTTTEPINLTKSIHPNSTVEIQSLDIRYDAKAVVFSMRKSEDEGFRLYELKFNDRYEPNSIRQISYAPKLQSGDDLIHHIDPIYSPGPHDAEGTELSDVAVSFMSNEAGHYASSDLWGIPGEADDGTRSILIDAQIREKPGTYNGRQISFVSGSNSGEWRTITKHAGSDKTKGGAKFMLDRPFPFSIDQGSVYVIEQKTALVLPSFDLWRMIPKDGEAEMVFTETNRRMSFTTSQERRPSMRTTGEVMMTSVRNIGYQGRKPVFNGAIFRMQAGGFDYHIHGGNRSRYPIFADSRELPQGVEIRLALDPRNLWGAGLLLLSDHGFGVNAEPDNPVDRALFTTNSKGLPEDFNFNSPPRYIAAQLNLFPETGASAVTHTGLSPGGSFRDPFPMPDGRILVAHTAETIDHLDEKADPAWGIYVIEFENSMQHENGVQIGEFELKRIFTKTPENFADYNPRPLIVRLKEKPHTHQKFHTNIDNSLLKDDYGVLRAPEGTPGEVECYDYPLLQSFLTHFAPTEAKDFKTNSGNPSGKITDIDNQYKYVRVLTEAPHDKDQMLPVESSYYSTPYASRSGLGIHTEKVIVAEVPIEEDGSFYVEVPPNKPLIIQGLNHKKMALHSMNRWFYVQPGEKLTFSIPRSIFPLRCAGCHGALTDKASDAFGQPDLVSAASRVMATWDPANSSYRKPYGYESSADENIKVDFYHSVRPILNEKCISCHNQKDAQGGLRLDDAPTHLYDFGYESLLQQKDQQSHDYLNKKYINEREALSGESFLFKVLLDERENNIHPHAEILAEEEILAIIRWIDLGSIYKGSNGK